MKSKHYTAGLLLTGAVLGLAGCGSDDEATPPAQITGTFLDSAVEGLDYVAGSAAVASTDAAGHFTCRAGETLTFSVGGVVLGSAPCAELVTPLALAGTTDASDVRVVNRLQALQLLDDDADPSNGIRLTAAVRTALKDSTLDFARAGTEFGTALQSLLPKLPESYRSRAVDDEQRKLAREHFEDTLARNGKAARESVSQTQALGTVAATLTRHEVQAASSFNIAYEGSHTGVKADFPQGFLPAYGSGLAFKGKQADGTLEFYGITDRGPNGDGPNAPIPGGSGTSISKVFPAPSFTPSFGLITVGAKGAQLTSSVPLKASSALAMSGLPIANGSVSASGEVPLTDAFKFDTSSKVNYNANGIDPESLVLDKARNALWSSDEYGPFMVRINITTGMIEKKYAPGSGLPAVLAQRRSNRGMEGLTLDASGKLHGVLQSPLDPKDVAGKSIKATPPGGASTDVRHLAKFARWVEFDPTSETSKTYAYPIDGSVYDKNRTGNAKLGDVVSLGNGKFIVIEQGARKSDAKVQNWLMLVEIPAGATDIAALDQNLEISSITGAVSGTADYSQIVTLKKTRLFDLNAAGWLAEKAEGLALVDDNTLALINDNDFGLRTVLLDANGAVVSGSIEDCTVDANGTIVSGCPAGAVAARITRGLRSERAVRLWLLKFDRKLGEFTVPAGN